MRRLGQSHRPGVVGWWSVVAVALVVCLLVPFGAAGAAPKSGDEVVLSGKPVVSVHPVAGAPSDAGLIVGSPPSVTGDASVDASSTPPRAVATVSARGRSGQARARMGAAFTTTAPTGTAVLGTLDVTMADLSWAGELRWDGAITDFSAPGPGGAPDGCLGCLEGTAGALVVASVVNLDTGETLAAQQVAAPARRFSGAGTVTHRVAGTQSVTFEDVVVPSGTRVGVYVTLTTRATSNLRSGATSGAATAEFSGSATSGTTTTTGPTKPTTGPTKPTTRPKPGTGATPFGVSYRAVTVQVVKTEPLVTPSACTGTEVTPSGPGQTALVGYFRAIDDGDYATAYGLLAPSLQSGWASIGPSTDGSANFAAFMSEHVDCVVVTGISTRSVPGDPEVSASLGIQWYEVALDAHYHSPFPAGSGGFPPFYKVKADPHTGAGRPPDQILDIVTSLPQLPATTVPPTSTSTTSASTTTTTRPTASTTTTSTTTTSTTTTSTTLPPRALSGPTTVVSLGDSFISGEAGRWNGNAFNPLLDRSGTDRAFRWGESTTLVEITEEVSSWSFILGWFTKQVTSLVEQVIDVPTYPTEVVYGTTDAGVNHCHRSDVAMVNAPIPGIDEHINLACSGAIAENLLFTGYPPHRQDGPLPAGVSSSSVAFALGVPQVSDLSQPPGNPVTSDTNNTQLERLLAVAREDRQIRLIELSIGGNDLEFSTVVTDCVMAYAISYSVNPVHCRPAWEDQIAESLDDATPEGVPKKVERVIDTIRLVMETPYDQGGAGYSRDQYRIVLQSYPSPIPRGSDFAMAEALPVGATVALALTGVGLVGATAGTNARIVYGCPFWDSDATWARDTLVPQFSDALRGVAERKDVAFLDLQDYLQNREVCSKYTTTTLIAGSPSGATSEWARSIYVSAHFDLFQGDPKEAIHPNAYAQQGLQRCLVGAYNAALGDATATLRCLNRPGGPESVYTVVDP